MNICGAIAPAKVAGSQEETCECLRPEGHYGPHLIQRNDGEYILFEWDWECDCEYCQSEDRARWCALYKKISGYEAQFFIAEPKRSWNW
jgi:hypothetical protein